MNREAKSGKDPELKAFAKETLATVKEHHALAKEVKSDAKGAAGEKTSRR